MALLMRQWKWNLYSNIMFINIWEYPETMSITRKRSRCKRPYSVIKEIFHGVHVFVITVSRVNSKKHVHVPCSQYHVRDKNEKEENDSMNYGIIVGKE
ncbi:hypothetical protein OXIME_000177 [Oxyplasma meridianum]|uniref:Uncharacterized protein n=1 Tax=Oxyplasma meridianum TaxID=3073602 RepID=A0AAX4NEM6_9ARCH